MDPILAVAALVTFAAVAAVAAGAEVRLTLLAAALVLGTLAGDAAMVVREFLGTFSNERYVVPICSAMGFAHVLKHTGCDAALVRMLMAPVRRVRALLVPALVTLLGRWNWWLPGWAAKVLRVEPSPLAPRQPVD